MARQNPRKQARRPKQPGSAGMRWLLIVLVLVAVLIILLRMAEFSGHRAPRARHRMVSETRAP